MWTDSWSYATWGRGHFGWPIELAPVLLDGGFWQGDLSRPAHARVESMSLGISELRVSEELVDAGKPPLWITPRRYLHRTEAGWSEYRDVEGLVPAVVTAGRRYRCSGSVDVSALFDSTDECDHG